MELAGNKDAEARLIHFEIKRMQKADFRPEQTMNERRRKKMSRRRRHCTSETVVVILIFTQVDTK